MSEIKTGDRPTTAGAALGRRDFLRGASAIGAGLLAQGVAQAQTAPAPAPVAATAPAGKATVIRGGHVLSMDTGIGDFATGDVHIENGRIVAVGARLDVPGAEIIDATDMIVMPGFVDSHSHLWNAFLRGSIRGDDPVRGYFPTTNRASPLCTPEDAFNSVRFGLMEALLSGTTTVNNFSHNTLSVAHADAEIRAALDVGARTRFSYGTPGRGRRLDLVGVETVKQQWGAANPLVTLGVNLQLPAPDVLKSGGADDVFVNEVRFARKLDLPVSLHYGNTAQGLVGFMQKHDLLGPDVLMIHAQGYTPEERKILVDRNVPFSMSPAIEIPYSTVRNGYIQFAELEKLGAVISLSLDASSAMATADYFTIMRALQWSHKQRADVDRTLEPRRIVEIATLGGAKALQRDDAIGSLTPGKQADVILIRKNDINMAPVIDPYYAIVYSGSPANVERVIVGGETVVRKGQHQRLDVAEVVGIASRAGRDMHDKLEAIIKNAKENPQEINRKG